MAHDHGAANAQWRARQVNSMSGEATAAYPSPGRLLPSGAVGHLAHELRGAIHVIRGHAELLRGRRRAGVACERRIHLRRERAPGGPVRRRHRLLAASRRRARRPGAVRPLRARSRAPARRRGGRGVRASRRRARRGPRAGIRPFERVRRVVGHVLEHVVRNADVDVKVAASLRPVDESPPQICMITASPVPAGALDDDDAIVNGTIAIAARILAAHCGYLDVAADRLEMLVRVSMAS